MNNIFFEESYMKDDKLLNDNINKLRQNLQLCVKNKEKLYCHGNFVDKEAIEAYYCFSLKKYNFIYEFNITNLKVNKEDSETFSVYIASNEKSEDFYNICNLVFIIITLLIDKENIGKYNVDVNFD